MILVGRLLFAFQRSFGEVLPDLLPVIYGLVILMGVMMLTGRNSFSRLGMINAPVLGDPYAAAFTYGLLLGPRTLPCTGPLIVSAFLLGAGSAAGLAGSLLYFLVFGLGSVWPLIILHLVALPIQRRFTGWTSAYYKALTILSGLLLVIIGLAGFFIDLIPNL
jgi:cytochrome c biogenesis protein CcdA